MFLHAKRSPVQETDSFADQRVRSSRATSKSVTSAPHATVARGIIAVLGLDIRAALLATLVDAMVFGAEVLSVGTLIPVAIAAAAVLGFVVFRIQRRWYGDDRESAMIKALAIALLTAIPVPLTPFIAIPCGALGIIKGIRQ